MNLKLSTLARTKMAQFGSVKATLLVIILMAAQNKSNRDKLTQKMIKRPFFVKVVVVLNETSMAMSSVSQCANPIAVVKIIAQMPFKDASVRMVLSAVLINVYVTGLAETVIRTDVTIAAQNHKRVKISKWRRRTSKN